MLLRLVAVTLLLAGCSTGGDDIETLAQSDPATEPDCSGTVQLPAEDPVAPVRLASFDARDGGFGAMVQVQPLGGDLELRDVPRPIPTEQPDSPLWLNASIPTVGTFTCYLSSVPRR